MWGLGQDSSVGVPSLSVCDYEEYYILRCDAVESDRTLPTFQRNVETAERVSKLNLCVFWTLQWDYEFHESREFLDEMSDY
jgi:hypothetical protein